MSAASSYSIGALSRRSGVKVETIRYYEKEGLLPKPPRTAAGHRTYDKDHLKHLIFVRRSRELGFTLNEVRDLLGLVRGKTYTCGEVRALTMKHADDIRSKIADLQRMERSLIEISSECEGGTVSKCPIIDALLDLDRS